MFSHERVVLSSNSNRVVVRPIWIFAQNKIRQTNDSGSMGLICKALLSVWMVISRRSVRRSELHSQAKLEKLQLFIDSTVIRSPGNHRIWVPVGSKQSLSSVSIFVPNFCSFLIIRQKKQKIKILFYSGNFIQDWLCEALIEPKFCPKHI